MPFSSKSSRSLVNGSAFGVGAAAGATGGVGATGVGVSGTAAAARVRPGGSASGVRATLAGMSSTNSPPMLLVSRRARAALAAAPAFWAYSRRMSSKTSGIRSLNTRLNSLALASATSLNWGICRAWRMTEALLSWRRAVPMTAPIAPLSIAVVMRSGSRLKIWAMRLGAYSGPRAAPTATS